VFDFDDGIDITGLLASGSAWRSENMSTMHEEASKV
jgi:hypothetical protein